MNDPVADFKILRDWKRGDTREIHEAALKKARLEDRYDSYSQTYQLDGRLWKIRGQTSRPTGETLYTLVCVNE
jgi:hypothetical protein